MAWRLTGKRGIRVVCLAKSSPLLPSQDAAMSRIYSRNVVEFSFTSSRSSIGFPEKSQILCLGKYDFVKRQLFVRLFYSSSLLLDKRSDDSYGLKAVKKEKYVKRDNRTKPPVEAPYTPPKVQRITKSLSDRTIDIFEGMTIVELSKRTGKSISTLQEILLNVGSKLNQSLTLLVLTLQSL